MQIRRLDLAESCGDDKQWVRTRAHPPEASDESRSFNRERVNQVRQILPLYNTSLFQARDCVIAERECSLLNPGKPACETRKIKRALFASIHEYHAVRRLDLGAATRREDRNWRMRYRSCGHLPCKWGGNECAASSHSRHSKHPSCSILAWR